MDFILAMIGFGVVVWALSAFFSPPGKHKDFTFRDQQKATSRAMGGDAPPDANDILPPDYRKKK